MSGTLYIVPTPVGNMDDMSPRAIDILRNVNLILAEDTRTSAPLLKRFDINVKLQSHHKFNEHSNTTPIIERLKSGENIALISDAGTPGISDPGFMLSRECRLNGLKVITLPGPTAFVPALINSGLPCERFVFQGFLPMKKGRKTRLEEIAKCEMTTIIYESPLRTIKTLKELSQVCGSDREASVSREISKLYEETLRGSLNELIETFSQREQIKGEIVIILAPERLREKKEHKNKYLSQKMRSE